MKSISIACLLSVPVWAIILPSPRETYAEALWDSEVQCLAIALWHEARGEPLEGRRAVAEVILNRRDSGRFPDTVCESVTQPGQFVWFVSWPVEKPHDWDFWYNEAHERLQERADGISILDRRVMRFCSVSDHCKGSAPGAFRIGNHYFWSDSWTQ